MEQLETYFVANDITAATKKCAVHYYGGKH